MPDPKPKLSERVRAIAVDCAETADNLFGSAGLMREIKAAGKRDARILNEAADFIAARETEDDRG